MYIQVRLGTKYTFVSHVGLIQLTWIASHRPTRHDQQQIVMEKMPLTNLNVKGIESNFYK